jgi:hypothetical protein
MLTRSAATTIDQHRRLTAVQIEAREATRRAREKSEELRTQLSREKIKTPQDQ